MSYKQIIWDWNGTLMDDAWLCVEVMNHILAQRNIPPVSVEHYRAHFTFPVINYYNSLGFDTNEDTFEKISHIYIAEYDRRRFECALHLGSKETLAAIAQSGIEQVVLSAYLERTLHEVVAHYGIDHHFTKLIGNRDIFAHGKVQNFIVE